MPSYTSYPHVTSFHQCLLAAANQQFVLVSWRRGGTTGTARTQTAHGADAGPGTWVAEATATSESIEEGARTTGESSGTRFPIWQVLGSPRAPTANA